MQTIKFRTLTTSLVILVLINIFGSSIFKASQKSLNSPPNHSSNILGTILNTQFNDQAEARRSGGRSGGGSFRRSPSSPPVRSNPAPIESNPNRSGGNTIIAPIFIPSGGGGYNNNSGYRSGSSSSSSEEGSWVVLLIVLLIVGGTGCLMFWAFKKVVSSGNSAGMAGNSELTNNKVTISKLQVGLLAEARAIKQELAEISMGADTDTPEGLVLLLQEAAIALLRTPENWVYVSASSQATDRDRAEGIFNNLSVAERSKFSAETLVNVSGRVRTNQNYKAELNQDPAAYIVVTLLVGTEYDKPLFDRVNSRETLQAALEKMAGVSPDALSIFELLWTPQSDADALSSDEMLTEYTDMVAI